MRSVGTKQQPFALLRSQCTIRMLLKVIQKNVHIVALNYVIE